MAKRLLGKEICGEQEPILREKAAMLEKYGTIPTLAVLRVGARDDDLAYERALTLAAGKIGVLVRPLALASDISQEELLKQIRALNADASVHGVLIFRPLPDRFDDDLLRNELSPAKDVDGITDVSCAALYGLHKINAISRTRDTQDGAQTGDCAISADAQDGAQPGDCAISTGAQDGAQTGDCAISADAQEPYQTISLTRGYVPCTAEAVLHVLDHYGIGIAGSRVAVLGRSKVIGKPLSLLLLARDATVTICHRGTENLSEHLRGAQIVVCAAGFSGGRNARLGSTYFSGGQCVIDVGIHADENGLYGDVDTDTVSEIVKYITPVPGGIGTVTTLCLLEHVIHAAESAAGADEQADALLFGGAVF